MIVFSVTLTNGDGTVCVYGPNEHSFSNNRAAK